MFELSIDKDLSKEVKRYLTSKEQKITSKLRTKFKESMEYLKDKIASYAPTKTGDLKKIIQGLEISGLGKGSAFSFTKSGSINIAIRFTKRKEQKILWIDRGTGIYGPFRRKIRPVNSQFLYFKVNGKLIRTRSVEGQKGKRFISKALNASRVIIISKIRSVIKD